MMCILLNFFFQGILVVVQLPVLLARPMKGIYFVNAISGKKNLYCLVLILCSSTEAF